ncbi:MAG: PRD domain-containing protein [Lachnospiraceae bacterium]|nr:PRD domain-containing protein [Lachnospiraceae bacterium]
MRVIKNINNNVSLCLDSNQNEVVVFGKGIGFTKPPYDIPLSKIERTFYGVNPTYLSMIHDIPEYILKLSVKVIDYARLKLDNPVSSNIVFTLADHIHFAIQRYEKNMNIQLPIVYDVQYLFETEIEIGKYALELLQREYKTYLPKEEATYIALHLINAESQDQKSVKDKLSSNYIEDITEIVENYFEIQINREGFNYSRFVSHMHYLMKRGKNKELAQSDNLQLYDSLKNSYEKTFECAQLIKRYIEYSLKCELNEEECIYLMLHINRLCAREDCDQ